MLTQRKNCIQAFCNFRKYSKLASKPWLNGPGLSDFLKKSVPTQTVEEEVPSSVSHYLDAQEHQPENNLESEEQTKNVFVETYGCQMNVNDTEIIQSVMKNAGYNNTNNIDEANVVFLNTCAIREGAEQKIWDRLSNLRHTKKRGVKIGVLGCMAERLKEKLLERDRYVDIVAGPDSYRDLPRLLGEIEGGQQHAVNVILSADETYADIAPVRLSSNGVSAYVTIMRGCDNMCSYCIVPFTRGRERSRSVHSIEDEVRLLSEQGYKEITLLGQNVNSYVDRSEESSTGLGLSDENLPKMSDGFKTIYKLKKGGLRFTELVERVSNIDPEMRIRFTSPHPKDFPDDLLDLVKDRHNVCRSLHVPAQHGNDACLERMRRGYTKESYLELVDKIRKKIPDVSLSSDFISGFCGETELEHSDTISLLQKVKFEHAFLFAYSMREKTNAHRKLKDDVEESVKLRRLQHVTQTFREQMLERYASEVGTTQLVLIDGKSKRSKEQWVGRTDNNKKVIFDDVDHLTDVSTHVPNVKLRPGDYVTVKINDSKAQTLFGTATNRTNMKTFYN
ncbi:mitochondrial tRNA-methylthiotransferase [Acrasis kona]|uniref:Mitochondrial tRNA-methylthiotransferase n=1 Tax=Acrasis kona TaxID=1008807 RepID=A0AAW2ZB73_9EUKA